MEIPFDGIYDRRVFMRGLRIIEKSSLSRRILLWVILIVLVLAIGTGIYSWVKAGGSASNLTKLVRPALLAAVLGYYYLNPYLSRLFLANRLFKDHQSVRMSGCVDLDGIVMRSVAGQEARFPWDRFMRKSRQDELVALLTVDGTLTLFQRDFFLSEPDWARFLQLVDQRVIEPK